MVVKNLTNQRTDKAFQGVGFANTAAITLTYYILALNDDKEYKVIMIAVASLECANTGRATICTQTVSSD